MNMAMCECDEAARIGGRLSPWRRTDCMFRIGGGLAGSDLVARVRLPNGQGRAVGGGQEMAKRRCLVQDTWPLPAPTAAPISGRVGETPGDFTGI